MATKRLIEASSSTKKSPMVYLYGHATDAYTWYQFDVESLRLHSHIDSKKRKTECPTCYAMTIRPEPEPMQLSPFVRMTNSERGGSWTIVGEYIYHVGGTDYSKESYNDRQNTRNLLKLNAKNPSSGWKITSSSRNFALSEPFVALIGRKLYVLGGVDRNRGRKTETYWGETFDLDSKKWKVLEFDIKTSFGDYFGSNCVVVEKEGEDTRIVLFPSTNMGRLLFYNVTTGEFLIEDHPSLKGVAYERLVVNNSTFYWFTCDLYLHGYDIVEKRLLLSTCLKRELWTIPLRSGWEDRYPDPILVDLCNGKFLLITLISCAQESKYVAILDVVKEKDSLNVSVESLHTLLFDDPSFSPYKGMVMQV